MGGAAVPVNPSLLLLPGKLYKLRPDKNFVFGNTVVGPSALAGIMPSRVHMVPSGSIIMFVRQEKLSGPLTGHTAALFFLWRDQVIWDGFSDGLTYFFEGPL